MTEREELDQLLKWLRTCTAQPSNCEITNCTQETALLKITEKITRVLEIVCTSHASAPTA